MHSIAKAVTQREARAPDPKFEPCPGASGSCSFLCHQSEAHSWHMATLQSTDKLFNVVFGFGSTHEIFYAKGGEIQTVVAQRGGRYPVL